MLKTVSSITNALGAMNYRGTWNANTNTPTLASGAGVKGDYYVVSVSGTATLDGISNWGIGDWAAFNGTTWQRLEGGADLNGVNLSVSGTSNLTGDVTFNNNLIQNTASKGVNFTANTPAAGMTSQLLNWYEEGTWTPVVTFASGTITSYSIPLGAKYTRIGRQVIVTTFIQMSDSGTGAGQMSITGLPFTVDSIGAQMVGSEQYASSSKALSGIVYPGTTAIYRITYADATSVAASGSRRDFLITATYFV